MSSYQDIWFSISIIKERTTYFRFYHGTKEGISCPDNGICIATFRKRDFNLPRDIKVKYQALSRNNV